MAQIKDMIQTILEEMRSGNFSFLILVVGIVQLIVMTRNSRGAGRESGNETGRKVNERISPKSGEKGADDEIQRQE